MLRRITLARERPVKVLSALLVLSAGSAVAAANAALPEIYARSLRAAGIPDSAAGVVVRPVEAPGLTVEHNRDKPLNPASTMKLVTTYSALRILGPAYVWRTEVFAIGARQGDVVLGDVGVRGNGDPTLVVEQLWLLVQRLRGAGLREIRGDLVLDKSAFAPIPHDPAAFDGDALRTYNVGPDPLLLNYKAMAFHFVPDAASGTARVFLIPPLAGARVPATVRLTSGACGDWQNRLRADFAQALAPVFRGSFALACGERTWNLSLIDHTPYFGAVFGALWESAGGRWTGAVREGSVPTRATHLVTHESEPLAQAIRLINKYSNNVMAQQVFLTLGAHRFGPPATSQRGADAVKAWLAASRLSMPELLLENGAGLSRIERISAGSLARLLLDAYRSPVMPEFMASLPITGLDGTARHRQAAAGFAHIKTGMLTDVRAISGYVLAESGKRYVVVSLVNHANAGAMGGAHDALLEWIRREG